MTIRSFKTVVLVGTTGSSFYGFRADLIKDMVKYGHTVYAFTSESTEYCLDQIQSLGAIPMTYQLSRGGLNPFADIQSYLQLKKLFKKIKPDIVFSYFAKPVIYGSMAAKAAKVPVIIGMLEGLGYTFTDQPNGQAVKTKLVRNIQVFLYKMAFPCLDEMVFLNPDDRDDLILKHDIKVKNVHLLGGIGLNLQEYPYKQSETSRVKFLFIGRLLKEKGVFELIQAIRIVKLKYPNVKFTILGAIDHQNMGALTQE